MEYNLKKLNKKELLNVISKMKKNDLMEIINNKIGGDNEEIIKETNEAIRKSIKYNSKKVKKNKNYIMANDEKYNEIYEN